jgi:uncharacterized membrane protein
MDTSRLLPLGVFIILIGFFVLVAGTFASAGGGPTSSGGFILIGPFPIVFGNGPDSGTLATVGLVITAAMVAVYLVSFLVWRSSRRREEEPSR